MAWAVSHPKPARRPQRSAPKARCYDRRMIALGLALLTSFTPVAGDGLRLEFDPQMRTRVIAELPAEVPLGPFTYSETLLTKDGELRDFALQSHEEVPV